MSKTENDVIKEESIAEVRNFLCSYQFCIDMLELRQYERKRRTHRFDAEPDCDDLLSGNEAYWRARMYAVKAFVATMRNGREKLMIYYCYLRGESIEHAAALLDVSRRTGYRLHERGLRSAALLYERQKARANAFGERELLS